jgi:hypothetical protein
VPIPSSTTTSTTAAAATQVTPPPRPPAALRRMSSDVANVLAKAQMMHAGLEMGRRGRSGLAGVRPSRAFRFEGEGRDVYAANDDEEEDCCSDEEAGFDDRGLRSWTEATISGVSCPFFPWLSEDQPSA